MSRTRVAIAEDDVLLRERLDAAEAIRPAGVARGLWVTECAVEEHVRDSSAIRKPTTTSAGSSPC
jgi:hypothetical protein